MPGNLVTLQRAVQQERPVARRRRDDDQRQQRARVRRPKLARRLVSAATCGLTPCRGGDFDRTFDISRARPPGDQRKAAVTQLFYMINFSCTTGTTTRASTEAAGNAQTVQLRPRRHRNRQHPRRGAGLQRRNNANMSTPADGARPRMRCTCARPRSHGADQVVAAHRDRRCQARRLGDFGPPAFDLTGTRRRRSTRPTPTVRPRPTAATAFTNAGRRGRQDRGHRPRHVHLRGKAKNAQDAGAGRRAHLEQRRARRAGDGRRPIRPSPSRLSVVAMPTARHQGAAGDACHSGVADGAAERHRRDGAIDNAIVAHEWGHYLSNRLVGNANGLNANQSRGMGEGWSDFHALLLLVKAADARCRRTRTSAAPTPRPTWRAGLRAGRPQQRLLLRHAPLSRTRAT